MKSPLYWLSFMTLLILPLAEADESVAVHGVLTQGVFSSKHNDIYGDSANDVSFEYTQASLNLSARPISKLRLSGQVIYQNIGGVKNAEVDVDYLLADWQFYSGLDSSMGVRVGRYKNPLGLYNETSDIIFTRPSILLPQSVYPETARNVLLSSDGILLYENLFTDAGEYQFYLGYGRPRVDEAPRVPGDDNNSGKFDAERAFVTGMYFDSSDGKWKMGLTYFASDTDYSVKPTSVPINLIEAGLASYGLTDITAAELLPYLNVSETDGDVGTKIVVASLQYFYRDWIFTAEHIWQKFEANLDPVVVSVREGLGVSFEQTVDPSVGYWTQGYYVQAEKSLTPKLSAFLRWDVRYENRDDPNGKEFEAIYGGPRHFAFGKDASVGLRWAPSEHLLLNAELHVVDGTNWLPVADYSTRQEQSRYWNLAALAVSYRF